jgi:hypothetical protein
VTSDAKGWSERTHVVHRWQRRAGRWRCRDYPPTSGTTISASGSDARFPPEPARSRPRRASIKRPGLSMMSMVGAASRWCPIPRRRLSWLTRGAIGAAGLLGVPQGACGIKQASLLFAALHGSAVGTTSDQSQRSGTSAAGGSGRYRLCSRSTDPPADVFTSGPHGAFSAKR